jgi:hypothetical protein
MQELSDHEYIGQLFLKILGADWDVIHFVLLGLILGGLIAEARVNSTKCFDSVCFQ